MDWIVLGSGTHIPHPSRGSPAHLLREGMRAALFDSGSGTKDRLASQALKLNQLTHWIYSHEHIDHWVDLISLLFHRANAGHDKKAELTIIGPAEFIRRAQNTAREAGRSLLDDNSDIEWRPIRKCEEWIDCGWFRIRPTSVCHGRTQAVAWRIEGMSGCPQWSAAYSGDSGWCDGLIEAAKGVGTLVCECTFSNRLSNAVHMNPASVRKLADVSLPRKLVLTHLDQTVVDSGEIETSFEGYPGEWAIGHDGLVIRLEEEAC